MWLLNHEVSYGPNTYIGNIWHKIKASRYRTDPMIESGTDGFSAVDADWRLTYISEEGARLAGHSVDELAGKRLWEAFPHLDSTEFGDVLRRVMNKREAKELETYYPAFDSWYEMRVYPTEDGLSIYFRDVTELRERSQQFEAIFNNTYTFVGLLEPCGTVLEANDTALEFAGLDRDEVIGEFVWDLNLFQTNEKTRTVARNAVAQARRGELFQDEIRVQAADSDAVVEFTVRPLTNEAGEVTHLIPEGRDITKRAKVTQHLRQERDFIDKALDTLTDIFYVVGADGTFRRWNDRLPEVSGYTDEEIDEMHATDFFSGEDIDRITAAIEETLATGRAHVEAELGTADGEQIPYEFTGSRLTDPDGNFIGLVGVGRDISEKKKREHELQDQREHLQVLNSLNTVFRDITDAVIEQSTREEIEKITCEKLIESESYQRAWIADVDPDTGEINSRFETHEDSTADSTESIVARNSPIEQSPVRSTFQWGEVVVSSDVHADPDFEPWHQVIRQIGAPSFIGVPIVHDRTQFGILGIHSERDDTFRLEEQEIIEQLGEIIGYVFYAQTRKEALGSALQLTFRSETLVDPFPKADDEAVELSLEAVIPLDRDEGTFSEYWEINEEYMEAFSTAVKEHDPRLDIRLLGIANGTARFEVSAGAHSMSSAFAAQGGTLKSVSFTNDTIRMTGEFPESVDPKEITAAMRETIPDIQLISQKRVLTPEYLRRMVDENLTDRQQTVLQLAYFGDYFSQPRRSTGEELAEHIGITKQTFHHHLRNAEATVFERLFEDPDTPFI